MASEGTERDTAIDRLLGINEWTAVAGPSHQYEVTVELVDGAAGSDTGPADQTTDPNYRVFRWVADSDEYVEISPISGRSDDAPNPETAPQNPRFSHRLTCVVPAAVDPS